jgi:hypothetical protein
MTQMVRRALVAGVTFFALGLAAGCGGPEPVTPKVEGNGRRQVPRIGNHVNTGETPQGGGTKRPAIKSKSGPTVSSN